MDIHKKSNKIQLVSNFYANKCKIILSELYRLVKTRSLGVWRVHHQEDKKKGK